ncbi:glycosyl transferase [Limosilactobacillus reuteri]|uniref:Glycosyl transferase n=1 Tax=Limosilactobacillus reuteri TaxID=1598 RepID=A0A1Y2UPS2_LIMRT|nr:DUF1972 domain-containing protein [Limosilactobacillus reuteri]OTA84670.1 glycosyl transferase [Limosilactobacillus reuteri]
MQDVFIIGAKGIGNYGGYETFLKNLIWTDRNNKNIKYHIACKYNGQGYMDEKKLSGTRTIDAYHFYYYNAECFKIKISEKLGSAQAVYYDIASFRECINQIKSQSIKHPIVYILACRIGPFMNHYVKKIHKLGGKVFINPDGHEWMRAKWSKPIRRYWKLSEAKMVKHADLVICDSVNIEKYIHKNYEKYDPKTTFIAYGADIASSTLNSSDSKVRNWYEKHDIKENNYFLIVGRFVPENNYATILREFMKSNVKKDLIIVTNVEHNKFFEKLKEETHFVNDHRIKFVGTVYDGELLKYIREKAYGYIHGHSVGGTNPSLLEALSYTRLNLLYDVGFNKEVALDSALYWTKKNGSLKELLNNTLKISDSDIEVLSNKAKKRIESMYNWEKITQKYNNCFNKE